MMMQPQNFVTLDKSAGVLGCSTHCRKEFWFHQSTWSLNYYLNTEPTMLPSKPVAHIWCSVRIYQLNTNISKTNVLISDETTKVVTSRLDILQNSLMKTSLHKWKFLFGEFHDLQ